MKVLGPVHMESQVPSPKCYMDAYMAILTGGGG